MSLVGLFYGRGRQKQADDEWQAQIVQKICLAMIIQAPEDWDSMYLVLEPTETGLGTGMKRSAITPTLSTDSALPDGVFVMPDRQVMDATRPLEQGWVEHKVSFKRAILSATRNGTNWDTKIDYEH